MTFNYLRDLFKFFDNIPIMTWMIKKYSNISTSSESDHNWVYFEFWTFDDPILINRWTRWWMAALKPHILLQPQDRVF